MARQNIEATDTLDQGRQKINANDIEEYTHISDTSNPHSVTATQVGLGSVNNTADSAKPVSTAQQTALDLKQNLNSTFDRKTDTDYTLVLGDNGKAIEMDSTSAHTLTVPLNSSVAFPIGANIPVIKYNTGTVTIVATGGVTINSSSGTLIVENQHSAALLQKVGTNEWRLLNGSPALTWSTLTPTQTGIASGLSHRIKYIIEGKRCIMLISIAGTGNTLDPITITNLPGTSAGTEFRTIWVINNATPTTGRVVITGGTTTMVITATSAGGAFTDNTYREADFEIIYELS